MPRKDRNQDSKDVMRDRRLLLDGTDLSSRHPPSGFRYSSRCQVERFDTSLWSRRNRNDVVWGSWYYSWVTLTCGDWKNGMCVEDLNSALQVKRLNTRRNSETTYLHTARWTLFLANVLIQITPVWINGLYKFQFPGATPFLHLFLPRYGGIHRSVQLVVHKHMHFVRPREPGHFVILVLPNAFVQITGHTDIEGAVASTGKNIDRRLFIHHSSPDLQSVTNHMILSRRNRCTDLSVILSCSCFRNLDSGDSRN